MGRTYAVVWRNGGSLRRVGKLTIDPDGLRLDGGEPGVDSVRESFESDEISSVRLVRVAGARLDGRPTVAIGLGGDHEIRLTTVDGPGVLHEITRRLAQLVSTKA
jgi:hypothetical protein